PPHEGVHAIAPNPSTDHSGDQGLVRGLQARRQHVADNLGLGEVLDRQHLRTEEVGLGQGGLDAGDFFASLYESHEGILLLHSRLAGLSLVWCGSSSKQKTFSSYASGRGPKAAVPWL